MDHLDLSMEKEWLGVNEPSFLMKNFSCKNQPLPKIASSSAYFNEGPFVCIEFDF